MTNDEKTEIWRAEFEHICGAMEVLSRSINGNYINSETHHLWHGFLMAKRNQKIIDLPPPKKSDGFSYWHDFDIDCAIDAAGYEFRVSGDL